MKIETVEEYLARGGKVERYDYVAPVVKNPIKINVPVGRMMSLDEGAHFFSEFKPRKASKKNKIDKRLNLSLIPIHLITKLKEVGIDLEDYEV